MINRIFISDFFEKEIKIPILDTRTPAEFEKGHIPGAINLPLFTNEERVQVGTTYKRAGRSAAILLGFELTGNKWKGFIEKALEFAPDKKVLIHCWRGGMRSGAMAWALDLYGFDVQVIEGGYKSYRHWVLDRFDKKYKLLILGGMTGSHKTDILNVLHRKTEQTIDLEALANHKGSTFGSMGTLVQPSQEQFENNLAEELRHLNLENRIWVEDESASIGKIRVPQSFREQMQLSQVIEIKIEPQKRIDYLVNEYGRLNKDFLIDGTAHIQKKLGSNHAKDAITAINENRLEDFIRIVLVYYDKSYHRCFERRATGSVHPLEINYESAIDAAEKVISFSNKIGL